MPSIFKSQKYRPPCLETFFFFKLIRGYKNGNGGWLRAKPHLDCTGGAHFCVFIPLRHKSQKNMQLIATGYGLNTTYGGRLRSKGAIGDRRNCGIIPERLATIAIIAKKTNSDIYRYRGSDFSRFFLLRTFLRRRHTDIILNRPVVNS